jgi:hypothetical protein
MNRSMEAYRTARWYSSWILVTSLIPVILLYCVWVPLTMSGRLDGLDVEPTIDKVVTRPRSSSGIEVATSMLQSLLPPLADEAEMGYLSVAAHSRLATARKRVAVANHFDPNRFNHPSPFITSGPQKNTVNDRRKIANGPRDRDKDKDNQKDKSGKDKKGKGAREKKSKSKTHGIAKSKREKEGGHRPRSKSESELADQLYGAVAGGGRYVPELESDESSTSEEDRDDEPVYAVAHPSPFSSPSPVKSAPRVTIADPPTRDITAPAAAAPTTATATVTAVYGDHTGNNHEDASDEQSSLIPRS